MYWQTHRRMVHRPCGAAGSVGIIGVSDGNNLVVNLKKGRKNVINILKSLIIIRRIKILMHLLNIEEEREVMLQKIILLKNGKNLVIIKHKNIMNMI